MRTNSASVAGAIAWPRASRTRAISQAPSQSSYIYISRYQHGGRPTRSSEVHGAHDRLRIALARRLPHRRGDLLDLVVAQSHLRRGEVLFQIGHALGAGDRHDVLAAVQHPREREL